MTPFQLIYVQKEATTVIITELLRLFKSNLHELGLNPLPTLYLLGCLQGEVLDWAEAEELVLSVLSGLLREQTLSILTVL